MDGKNISLLFQQFPYAVNARESTTGNTPLMFAILKNEPQSAELLLNYPEVDVTIKNRNNETALSLTLEKMQQCNESDYYNLLSILSDQIDDEQLDRAFYFCNDKLAEKLILKENLNVNFFHIQPQPYPSFVSQKPKHPTDFCSSNSQDRSNDSSNRIWSTSLIHSIEKGQRKCPMLNCLNAEGLAA